MRYGSISLAAGVVLLLWSELAGLVSLRIAAAALMVAGAAGLGIATARTPGPVAVLNRVAGVFSRTAVCVAAAVLVAPVLLALAGALAGAASHLLDLRTVPSVELAAAGGAIGLLLLSLSVAALTITIGAIRGKAPSRSGKEDA